MDIPLVIGFAKSRFRNYANFYNRFKLAIVCAPSYMILYKVLINYLSILNLLKRNKQFDEEMRIFFHQKTVYYDHNQIVIHVKLFKNLEIKYREIIASDSREYLDKIKSFLLVIISYKISCLTGDNHLLKDAYNVIKSEPILIFAWIVCGNAPQILKDILNTRSYPYQLYNRYIKLDNDFLIKIIRCMNYLNLFETLLEVERYIEYNGEEYYEYYDDCDDLVYEKKTVRRIKSEPTANKFNIDFCLSIDLIYIFIRKPYYSLFENKFYKSGNQLKKLANKRLPIELIMYAILELEGSKLFELVGTLYRSQQQFLLKYFTIYPEQLSSVEDSDCVFGDYVFDRCYRYDIDIFMVVYNELNKKLIKEPDSIIIRRSLIDLYSCTSYEIKNKLDIAIGIFESIPPYSNYDVIPIKIILNLDFLSNISKESLGKIFDILINYLSITPKVFFKFTQKKFANIFLEAGFDIFDKKVYELFIDILIKRIIRNPKLNNDLIIKLIDYDRYNPLKLYRNLKNLENGSPIPNITNFDYFYMYYVRLFKKLNTKMKIAHVRVNNLIITYMMGNTLDLNRFYLLMCS